MLLKPNLSHICTFTLGAFLGAFIFFITNVIEQRIERLHASFVPETKIVETKIDPHTFLYQPPYTAKEATKISAAPLLDQMAARTRENNNHAFVMLAFNPVMLCQNLSAKHSDIAILMRPLSAEANEIVELP